MSIGDRVYGLHWYELQRDEQFAVRMMIQRAQKPFELKGLGVFVCSLETFLTVNICLFNYSENLLFYVDFV